jgi:N-acetylglucosamine kinase-like BadF-type ATPase
MNRFYIGIDGGGTKTAAKVVFDSGRRPLSLEGGPINICSLPKEQVRINLHDLISRILLKTGIGYECMGICAGVAGFSCSETAPFITACIEERINCRAVLVTSDSHIALYGALGTGTGIVLIAGTGSVCFGKNAGGEEWRTGGWGHIVDDEGGGYAVGRDILAAVLRSFDGRATETILTRQLGERFGLVSSFDIIRFVYDDGQAIKARIASLAPLLTEACDRGDPVALNIANRAASCLLELVIPVVERLQLQNGKMALRGSILKKNRHIHNAFKDRLKELYPLIEIIQSGGEPVDGAVFLAAGTHAVSNSESGCSIPGTS